MIDLHLSREIFNEAYLPYLSDYSHRYEVYYGGAGSGKSVFIAQKLLFKALNDKRKVLIVRKTLNSQKDSCWRLMLEQLSQWQIRGLCKVRITDFTIELPNGSTLLFKGLDDSERIKSIVGITDIWIEEATELIEEDFDQLDLRLRARASNLQMFVSFNPISKVNYVYRKWFADTAVVGEDTLIVKTTYKDNRFLPEEYIKSLEKRIHTNPTYYKIYALGEFCSLDKLVYNNWRVEAFEPPKDGKLIVGLDFGFTNDPTAIVASIVKGDDIFIFKEFTGTGKTNQQIAEIITSMGFAKSVIIADSAEPKSVAEIKRCGIQRIKESTKGKDSIIHGIQRLQGYNLIVHPSCENIITELENYSWIKDKTTGEYTNKPIDMFNHSLDALRYSLQALDQHKFTAISKDVLGL
jgi:phage terminase large subunit